MPRRATIVKVEQNGSELCELAANSSFVSVRVPVRVTGEGEKDGLTFRYKIGPHYGRESKVILGPDASTTLRFRVPQELFRPRERLIVEVLAEKPAGPPEILWTKRWGVVWQGKTPSLEPIVE